MVMKSCEAPMMAMERGLKKRSRSLRIADARAGARAKAAILISLGELLQPPPEARLAGIEIALRIGAEVMEVAELSGLAAMPRKAAEELAVAARQDVQRPALSIGDDEVALPGIGREHQVGHVRPRQARAKDFPHVGPVLAEHLDAVVAAVADVDQAVARQPDAVHGVGELLRRHS